MTFSMFSTYLERIEATASRNEITAILAEVFNALEPEEIEPACWLLLGRILPSYEGLEFQFAEKMMIRAIAQVVGKEPDLVLATYKQVGDLATVAQHEKQAKELGSTRSESVKIVYEQLVAIAREHGAGSQDRKGAQVVKLLEDLDPLSVRYIVRIILTKLRLGFSDMTILDALSWAVHDDKSARKALEEAYQMRADIGKLAVTFLSHGEEGLQDVDIELGIPLQPALCQRLKTADEMIAKMGKVFMESKYDGTRVQIHYNHGGTKKDSVGEAWMVRTFTRSLEESSAMFPELLTTIHQFGNHDIILDCEAVGFDPKTGKLLPFQETIQRKRKHDVAEYAQKIPLRFFIFDILYKDGKSLLQVPLSKRKELLHELFLQIPADSIFIESRSLITENPQELRQFHKQQLNAGLEGAVIKQYDSAYQPGRRGWSWVKFKEEETSEAKLSDTIDAVVMGYWYGKGKRNQFGIGAFLIGVAGDNDQILTLSKVGTGLSDEQWREMVTRCTSLLTTSMPTRYVVNKLLTPDVWVDPGVIVEVAGDELTKSPTHSAGVALRFPRLVRFRDDKSVEQITTQQELASIS